MTEGTGHVIDPDGDARRAVHEAVAEGGPEVLSDATIMENLCRTQLTAMAAGPVRRWGDEEDTVAKRADVWSARQLLAGYKYLLRLAG